MVKSLVSAHPDNKKNTKKLQKLMIFLEKKNIFSEILFFCIMKI